MEELIAAPRTLDVQQFAKARATELLSLHSVLKTRKRKASQQQDGSSLSELQGPCTHNDGDGDGDGDDQIDDVGLATTSTSLPRHLRRRTSSYVRRRRPLPWLYKRKKSAPVLSSTLPKKQRKRQSKRQKQGQLPQQNTSLAGFSIPTQHCGDSMNARQVPGSLASQLGLDSTPTKGPLNQRFYGIQPELVAPLSQMTAQTNLQQDQQETLNVQHVAYNVISSFQASEAAGATSVNIHGANALVHQLETRGDAAPENVEVVGASTYGGCIVIEEKSAVFSSQMDVEDASLKYPKGVTNTIEVSSHGVKEDGNMNSFQGEKDSIVSFSVTTPAQIVASQAAPQEVVQSEGNFPAPINVESIAPSIQAAGQACCKGQQDSIDRISLVAVNAPACITSDTQIGTFEVQDRRKKKKNMSRPLRRLLEFKPGGSLISKDGTRHLGTHVWHAKRFIIERMWGYRIPLGRHGRGHGSRSILSWSKSRALLHDSSFISAIQLQGTKEDIVQMLRPLLELPQGVDSYFEAGQRDSLGRLFITAILHHAGQAFHDIISPVILMWKPSMPETNSSNCTGKKNESFKGMSLWLWVHAAAFEEARQMLENICFQVNEQMKEERLMCFSRKGDLGRLDLVGEGSFAVLQKVLFPIYRDCQGKCIKLEELGEVLDPKQLEGKAVVHLEVCDPRLKENERCLALDPICISPVAFFDDRGSKSKEFLKEGHKITEAEVEPEQETIDMIHGEEAHQHYFSNKSSDTLWACEANSSQKNLVQPVREKFFSRMRHTDRLDAFGLTQSAKSHRMLERRKNLSWRFTCPVILLKHDHEKSTACGWSLIVPLSWISAFWVPLVFAGGHVIGIRERHWLCTDAGIPSFPDDFPDCKAYEDTKTDKSLQGSQFFCKRLTTIGLPISEKTCENFQEELVHCSLVQSPSMSCTADEGRTENGARPGCGCFVARTSERLVTYLQMTHQSGILLFPAQKRAPTKFKGLGNRLHEGTVVWRPKAQKLQVPRTTCSVQPVCLLRVCLRPFCKGVVKVGAMVYAPTSEDYFVWSSKEKASGISLSGMHGSEKAVGYVTSMAPRGSKVSAAIAFCDAVALGLARQRQWEDTTWHKKSDVFLMFCNEGSTTFRPAFASICIEAGPDI